MMKSAVALTLLLTSPAIAQQIPPQAQLIAEPAGKWELSQNEWQCILDRKFTVDGKSALFSLTLEPLEK